MRVYLDSSALLKRVVDEPESPALDEAFARFAEGSDVLVSSALTWIEVARALRSRLDAHPPGDLARLLTDALAGILECPISEQVVSVAQRLGPARLRSLDSIHLASATLVEADVICGYDRRLLLAAQEFGFEVLTPGTSIQRIAE